MSLKNETIRTGVFSEYGELRAVILRTPGPEVENMTPSNAQRALYSDILNLAVASKEYTQFKTVLQKFARTLEVEDLLRDILGNYKVKRDLLKRIVKFENVPDIKEKLFEMDEGMLAKKLIEGVELEKNTLTTYLSKQRYSLRPLHNFFFTRDASISIYNDVLIGKMANRVRERESFIMEAVFDFHPLFSAHTINPVKSGASPEVAIEGGDILIARDDIILIGIGSRTSTQGVDYLLETLKHQKQKQYVLVQELPESPESFIHLDMVFTFLDEDKCLIYEPLITKPNKYQTVLIEIDNGDVKRIQGVDNLLVALKSLGMHLKPVYCGGKKDQVIQEREQWHSGANFFAVGPGRVIGYGRNVYTIDELNKNGFEILKAKDIIAGKSDPEQYQKFAITIDGSELSRGGGGTRCMTMPVWRE